MSVVASIITKDGSWTAFDGRATRDGMIVSESKVKAEKINNCVCIGFTGTLEAAEAVMAVLHEGKNRAFVNALKSDSAAETLQTINAFVNGGCASRAQFLATGINTNGEMAIYTISTSNEISCAGIARGDEIHYVALLPDGVTLPLCDYVAKNVPRYNKKPQHIKLALTEYICAIAKESDSINSNIRYIYVGI